MNRRVFQATPTACLQNVKTATSKLTPLKERGTGWAWIPPLLFCWALLLHPAALEARPLPVESPVPGGVVILVLAPSHPPKPQVRFQGKEVMVIDNDGQWTAVLGIPLKTRPGPHTVEVTRGGDTKRIEVVVQDKEYPAQYIKLPKGKERYVSPPPEDLARIKRERKILGRILSTWSEAAKVDTDFHLPVKGRVGSPFGLRRYFNGEPRNPHSGLDLVAPSGTPIKAPAAGKVIDTGDFFFTGNAVFLDHGQGLISGYFHMQRIDVKPGQTVQRGDILGAVGATGRVTGPHLHMNVYLNRTKVDPELFLRRYLKTAAK